MTSGDWRRVWQLCEDARQLPPEDRPSYVRAHAADHDVAQEVLSLLAEPDHSIVPSWTTVGHDLDGPEAPLVNLTGSQLGRYLVGNLLGSGSGGRVYAAHDTQLERRVAMKFLRHRGTDSSWRMDSFLREAKAASSLNHPGIVTVYEVMQSEPGLAIVMELVEGKALREFCGSPSPIDFVARAGSQVANALAAAHGGGIVHRDIKPENIMIRNDGIAKVLDFGIAQTAGDWKNDPAAGLMAGTLRYMSPEQSAGKPLTSATDIFSLGIVLYELVTGRHPWLSAASDIDPQSRWRRDIPKPLETLLLSMLRSSPEARPTAKEVADKLDALARPAPASRARLFALLTILAGVSAGLFWFTTRQAETSSEARLTGVPLTATAGFDSWPDISPDGKTVVYGWGRSPDAHTHLYLKDLDGDAPRLLLEAEPGTRVGHPKWSADGNRIFYKRPAPHPGRHSIWSIARDGTDPRLTTFVASADPSSGLDCSLDGKRIIFADLSPQTRTFAIHSLDLASGEITRLTTPGDGWGDWDPHYSQDGKEIAFKRVAKPGDDQLYVMSAAGGPIRRLPLPRQSIVGHAWLPGGRLLLSAQLNSVIHGLWSVSARGLGDPVPLYESGLDAAMPAVRGDRIVWVNRLNDYNIYSVPLAGGTPVKRIASPVLDSRPAFAPDGRLAFVSRRSGSQELWMSGPDGANAVRITNLRGEMGRPSWSSDGMRIAFSMERFAVTKVFVARCPVGLSCESPEVVADGSNPSWSPDGSRLYFSASPSGIQQIFGFRLPSGPAMAVSDGHNGMVSTDGKWLYVSLSAPEGRFFRIPLSHDGAAAAPKETILRLETNAASLQHWTVAGEELVFYENDVRSKFSGLRAYNLVTKRLRTVVETAAAEFPAVTPNGKAVWYAQPDASGATLMSGERQR